MLPRKAKSEGVTFFQRTYPSGNFALIHGARPLLIDSGFGSEAEKVLRIVEEAGAHPRDLQCLANTHYHVDHAGGNAAFQREGVRIAAHRVEAMMVNYADTDACGARWLDHPIEQYQVDLLLEPGMTLETGSRQIQVLGTPGHTLGHLSFLVDDGTLIAGDVFFEDDLPTLNPFREGAGGIFRLMDTLTMLSDPPVPLRRALCGHGAAISKPYEAISVALERLERWLENPEKAAWHAIKRAAVYRLMIIGSSAHADFVKYLSDTLWLNDYANSVFHVGPVELAAQLVEELTRTGALSVHDKRIACAIAHTTVPPEWLNSVPPMQAWRAQTR